MTVRALETSWLTEELFAFALLAARFGRRSRLSVEFIKLRESDASSSHEPRP
jgi:hypothetical protein